MMMIMMMKKTKGTTHPLPISPNDVKLFSLFDLLPSSGGQNIVDCIAKGAEVADNAAAQGLGAAAVFLHWRELRTHGTFHGRMQRKPPLTSDKLHEGKLSNESLIANDNITFTLLPFILIKF